MKSLSDLESIGRSHRDVGYYDIGTKAAREFQSLVTVPSLPADLIIGSRFKDGAYAPADNGMIIGKKDTKMWQGGHPPSIGAHLKPLVYRAKHLL